MDMLLRVWVALFVFEPTILSPKCDRLVCHCKKNLCNADKTCKSSSRCFAQWIGPACQYANVTAKSVVVNFKADESKNSPALPCVNRRTLRHREFFYYIHCNATLVKEVILSGPGVKALCTVSINQGRNIAVKLKSQERVTKNNKKAPLGNDGDVSTCSQAKVTGGNPAQWKVTFDRPYIINLYIVQPNFSDKTLLSNMFVEAFYLEKVVYNFSTTNRNNIPSIRRTFVTSVRISAPIDIELCEFEAYAEHPCPHRTFGHLCEHVCHCSNNASCDLLPWTCPSGCDPGWRGERCVTPCKDGFYGKKCASECSARCRDKMCDHITGICKRCIPGFYGKMCDNDINDTRQVTTTKPCEYCVKTRCDDSGTCLEGCASGYVGAYCDRVCPEGVWGLYCSEDCNENCVEGVCEANTGICQIGCIDGYIGSYCNDKCPAGQYGKECALECSKGCLSNGTEESPDKCSFDTGQCYFGCLNGFAGALCNIIDSDPKGLNLVPFVATAATLVVVLILVFLLCRKKKEPVPPRLSKKSELPEEEAEGEECETEISSSSSSGHRRSSTTIY